MHITLNKNINRVITTDQTACCDDAVEAAEDSFIKYPELNEPEIKMFP